MIFIKEKAMEKARKQRTNHPYSALQKCQAVLSIWTERRKPAEVGKEMGVTWAILKHWQDRALEGMLQALESHVNLDKGPALTPRLQMMLEKRKKIMDNTSPQARKLTERLAQIDKSKKEQTGQKT
jgi:hypothetical protein